MRYAKKIWKGFSKDTLYYIKKNAEMLNRSLNKQVRERLDRWDNTVKINNSIPFADYRDITGFSELI